MATTIWGSVILTLHGAHAPTAAEWKQHLDLLSSAAAANRHSLARCTCLVFTAGGMPDSAQRAASRQLIDAVQGTKMPIAVVTTSSVARGIITAAHWFGLSMQAFAPTELAAALHYAGVKITDRDAVRHELDALATRVSCEAYSSTRW